MKTKICCIFGLAAFVIAPLFTMPARAANWVLAPDGSGQNLNTPGHKAKLTDADAPNNTLLVTIENAADHTLMLGRHTTDYGGKNATARSDRNAAYSGPIDLTKPIYAANGDTPWTIVSVANMAFYNNKALLTAPDNILDLSSVTNIGIGAFGNVTAMPQFRLSPHLERVGASAFMSTFNTTAYSPQLPASLKVVETGAFCHNDQYDLGINMSLQGEIELRGVEVIQSAAFNLNPGITAITIGPKLVELGVQGTNVRQKKITQGVFQKCDALKSITWLGPAPESFQANAFWTDNTSACVTNWVYIDHLDGWTNLLKTTNYTIGEKADDADVWCITPSDTTHKGTVWLALLPGHAPVEGAPVFNDAPTMTQSGGVFTFRANMSEGEDCNLFAVFTALDGSAVTNSLATGVDGDPDQFYTLTPTGLSADRTYSFGILGRKGAEAVFRAGVGTFFYGEVSVSAPAAFSEAGGTGSFSFSRNGTDGDLVVPFSLSGTASEFDNFLEIPRSVTILDGSSSATVTVSGVVDLYVVTDTTLTLTTSADSLFYVASAAGSATATIENWTSPEASAFAKKATYAVAGYPSERGDLSDFPVLVRIPGGTVSNPAQLAFFDEDGNPLYFEIDTWDASNESLAWVGLRTFRAGATITLAAGKSGYESPNLAYGLWRRADYILVLHCGDEGPTLAGSTVQGLDGTARSTSGGAADSDGLVAEGAAGAARTISNGVKNAKDMGAIRVPNFDRYLTSVFHFSVSLWLNHSETVDVGDEVLFGNRKAIGDEAAGFVSVFDPSEATSAPAFRLGGNSALPPKILKILAKDSEGEQRTIPYKGAWTLASFSFGTPDPTRFHFAGSRARILWPDNNSQFTQSGWEVTIAPISSISPTAPVFFGHGSESETVNSFKGALDEIRVRNVSNSDDWAFAEYATIKDPNFLRIKPSGVLFLIY